MDTISAIVLATVTGFSIIAVLVLLFLLFKEKEKSAGYLFNGSVRGLVTDRAEALKEFYGNLYYSCDNFPKYAGKLSGYFSKGYEDAAFRDFMADIVPSVNLAEGGAIQRLAAEYSLTDIELKTCCYIHLGFTWQQASAAEMISENAYNVRCSRIRKKLGLQKDQTISGFLEAYCKRYSNLSGQ